MTKEENKQYIKATALNKIRKLYHPLTKNHYTYYEGEGSRMEQMSFDVEQIIEQLEKDLDKLKG
jgi:hypothetical protein